DALGLRVAGARARPAHHHRAGSGLGTFPAPGGLDGMLGGIRASHLARGGIGHVRRLLRLASRAIRVSARIIRTSVSAAPHALPTRRSCAWPMSLKIWAGRELVRCERSKLVPFTSVAVNRRDAVSAA